MGEVVAFPGAVLPEAATPDEPCPNLIASIQRALEQARAGEITAFIMLVEHPEGSPKGTTGCIFHTDCARDLANFLVAMKVEEFRLTEYLAGQTKLLELEPPEPA